MAPTQKSEYQVRLLKRLSIVVDLSRPDFIREAAIKSVQAMLPSENPLRLEEPSDLLERVLPSWGSRRYLVDGRGVMRTVSRPPTSLRDVWS